MVATPVLTLIQVPPPGAPLSDVLSPTQASNEPEIVGSALIVTIAEVAVIVGQPVVLAESVYTPALVGTTPVTPVLNDVGAVIAVPPGPAQA